MAQPAGYLTVPQMDTLIEQQTDATWLIDQFTSKLASTIAGLTGEKNRANATPLDVGPVNQGLMWRQPFQNLGGAVWIVAADESWRSVGGAVLNALGIEESADQLRSEYLELVRQAAAGVAQAISEKLGMEVTPGVGEQTQAIGEAQWSSVELTLAEGSARIAIGFDAALLAALMAKRSREIASTENANAKTAGNSKTFDVLLDLELPVSISFGRAHVPLKDVLKLAVGSIVKLNRAVGDRVEVIVNNCVIARGQVVVVDGNFGVRIDNVISTQERLKTLD